LHSTLGGGFADSSMPRTTRIAVHEYVPICVVGSAQADIVRCCDPEVVIECLRSARPPAPHDLTIDSVEGRL
jgi:hypothetical protein